VAGVQRIAARQTAAAAWRIISGEGANRNRRAEENLAWRKYLAGIAASARRRRNGVNGEIINESENSGVGGLVASWLKRRGGKSAALCGGGERTVWWRLVWRRHRLCCGRRGACGKRRGANGALVCLVA
jgi:hypothetical protein